MQKGTITKEVFCAAINALKKQQEDNRQIELVSQTLFEGPLYFQATENLETAVIDLLKATFDDTSDESDIDYFIYELDYGTKYTEGCYTIFDKPIKLATSEDLYDLLTMTINQP